VLSLDELLSKYNPKLLSTEKPIDSTSETTVRDSTSVTTKTEHQNPQKILGNRIIYLTVDAGITSYTGAVLDTLSAYGYKATFFIDKDDITDYPLTLARIISEGHKLGIRPNTADVSAYTDIDSFINELDETNKLLYRVYKIKTRTVRPDVLAYNNTSLTSDLYSDSLAQNGYVMWNASAKKVDGIKDNVTAIDELINSIWSNNTLVMDFGSNYATPGVLSGVLSFILSNADKCDLRLADSSYNPPVR
jgi:peptidoglycan/xylan/chitin deacetylase (PgdA/CDA1 family)